MQWFGFGLPLAAAAFNEVTRNVVIHVRITRFIITCLITKWDKNVLIGFKN